MFPSFVIIEFYISLNGADLHKGVTIRTYGHSSVKRIWPTVTSICNKKLIPAKVFSLNSTAAMKLIWKFNLRSILNYLL